MILKAGNLIAEISLEAHDTEENKALENTPKDINTMALNGLRGILPIYVKRSSYNKEHKVMIFWVSIVCLYGNEHHGRCAVC